MPSLGGATAWLNSEPLGPAEQGNVVVVNFWTKLLRLHQNRGHTAEIAALDEKQRWRLA